MDTIESMLAELERRKMKVLNFYEGTDSVWRCLLRSRRNDLDVKHGRGKTAADALRKALEPEFEDLL